MRYIDTQEMHVVRESAGHNIVADITLEKTFYINSVLHDERNLHIQNVLIVNYDREIDGGSY